MSRIDQLHFIVVDVDSFGDVSLGGSRFVWNIPPIWATIDLSFNKPRDSCSWSHEIVTFRTVFLETSHFDASGLCAESDTCGMW